MLTATTITKLREMRLSVMANALKDQLEDPQFRNIAFEDRLGFLVDAEWNARKKDLLDLRNSLDTLIRNGVVTQKCGTRKRINAAALRLGWEK